MSNRSLKSTFRSLFPRKQASQAHESCSAQNPAASQAQSIFFDRLPYELRVLVYTACFRTLIHLHQLESGISHITCRDWNSSVAWDGHRHGVGSSNSLAVTSREDRLDESLLSLVLTCRKAHDEALPYLYSSPRFTVYQPSLLVSSYLHQVTINTHDDISMPQWKSICQSLAQLSNLTDLSILLHQNYFFVEQRGTPEIASLVIGVLRPLKQIKIRGGQQNFNVRILWTLTDEEREGLGICPFQIVEVGKRTFGGG